LVGPGIKGTEEEAKNGEKRNHDGEDRQDQIIGQSCRIVPGPVIIEFGPEGHQGLNVLFKGVESR